MNYVDFSGSGWSASRETVSRPKQQRGWARLDPEKPTLNSRIPTASSLIGYVLPLDGLLGYLIKLHPVRGRSPTTSPNKPTFRGEGGAYL